MVLGEANSGLYKGELSVAPIIEEWFLNGDVSVNGQVIAQEQLIELDSGTANIIGPIDIVQKIFDATGVTGIMTNGSGCTSTLVGVYPCSQPPKLGFGFPSMEDAAVAGGNSGVSQNSTIFDVHASAFPLTNDGNGTCTSALIGVNISLPQSQNRNLWVVGQPFFQTHYLDFNVGEGTVGFANQK
jgi:pepsin A